MGNLQILLTVLVIAVITFFLRLTPFVLFGKGRQTPSAVLYLGRVFPYAIMAFLVVYCFKGVVLTGFPFGLPELLAAGTVVGLQLWKKNNLISIITGTVLYMFLVQTIFP